MAVVESKELPFRQLSDQAEGLVAEIEPQFKQLRVVLRDITAAERNVLYRSACEQGEELFSAALATVDRARYVLNVIDAQHIGNTSSAWHSGVQRLRDAIAEVESLSELRH